MLELKSLFVRYGRVAVVRGVSLHVNAGEIVGLVGPNGAGKSTTLMTIAGLLRPAAGQILLEGEDVSTEDPERLVKRGIALVPEGRHVFGSLTVEENLRLAAHVSTKRLAQKWPESFEDVVARFPVLRKYWRSSAGKLSGGEQQQLALARALVCRPKLLLLDEPSLGLAPRLVDGIFELLTELQAAGMTILLVEQNATRTLELSDRAYVMKMGLIALEGTAGDLRSVRAVELEDAYLGATHPRHTRQ